MPKPLIIPYHPDNRDVYHTLDGQALIGFRFEQTAQGWSIYAEHLPQVLYAGLPGGAERPLIQVGLERPARSLREAKAYAAQWAEQLWRNRKRPLSVDPVHNVPLVEEVPR